jgi:hypothetical protein
MSRRLAGAGRRAALLVSRSADDILAVAGAACLAVAAGFLAPAGPWVVAGVFLLAAASSAGGRR